MERGRFFLEEVRLAKMVTIFMFGELFGLCGVFLEAI